MILNNQRKQISLLTLNIVVNELPVSLKNNTIQLSHGVCPMRNYSALQGGKKDISNIVIFDIDEIVDGIYIGDYTVSLQKEKLKELGITHILSLIEMEQLNDNFIRKIMPITDTNEQDIKNIFNECIDFIDSAINNKTKILVHCYKGISRSAAIVCAYLINKNKTTFNITITQMQQRRPCIEPNLGFCIALDDYYIEIIQKN